MTTNDHCELPIERGGNILFLKPFLGECREFNSHLEMDEQFVLEKMIKKYSTYSLVQCGEKKCKQCISKLKWDGEIVCLGVKAGQLLLHNKIGLKDVGQRFGHVWVGYSLKQVISTPKKMVSMENMIQEILNV